MASTGRSSETDHPHLAVEIKRNLRSDKPQDIAGFFYFPRSDGNIPTGCGYYLGYLMMAQMGEKYNLDELIHLSEEELVHAMDNVLADWVV